ncbi:hypothetical protein [Methylocaldum sp.]|uniref:hypothetical protein n=1 Tax=Methylocaldum sp. TaxID=1969727 RepID=UPI002D235E3B|nr:hypothetical protein [Methylocaldum sp.]HYE35497.1 hypothetical protein [Methylocaldum sp.]
MYSFETVHHIEYTTREAVPVTEIIKSLQGFDKVVRELPNLANALVLDGAIVKVELYVQEIATGSLIEDFILRFFFKDEEGFHAWITTLREKTGMENSKVATVVIGGLLTGALVYGVSLALPKDAPEAATATINGNQNNVIHFVAETLNVTPDAFRQIMETSIRDKKMLAQGAVLAVHPAKSDKEATIVVDNNEQTIIEAKTIQAAPERFDPPQPESKVEEFSRAFIQIRATDLDNEKQGWRCIVPGLSESRVKMVLDPTVDRTKLAREVSVMANIAVTSKFNPEKRQYQMTEVFLRDWEPVK